MTQTYKPDKSGVWQIGHVIAGPGGAVGNDIVVRSVSASMDARPPSLSPGSTRLNDYLDSVGMEGWEPVGMGTIGTDIHVILKRPLRAE